MPEIKRDLVKEARKALSAIWGESPLVGHWWGKKSIPDNPVAGKNIAMFRSGTIASLSEVDGKLAIREFGQTSGTELGEEVEQTLRAAGLPCKRVYPSLPQIPIGEISNSDHIWSCQKCGLIKGFNVDGLPDESDAIEKVIQDIKEHLAENPQCAKNPIIKIIRTRDMAIEEDAIKLVAAALGKPRVQ